MVRHLDYFRSGRFDSCERSTFNEVLGEQIKQPASRGAPRKRVIREVYPVESQLSGSRQSLHQPPRLFHKLGGAEFPSREDEGKSPTGFDCVGEIRGKVVSFRMPKLLRT
jgi:hypothetical protein